MGGAGFSGLSSWARAPAFAQGPQYADVAEQYSAKIAQNTLDMLALCPRNLSVEAGFDSRICFLVNLTTCPPDQIAKVNYIVPLRQRKCIYS